MSYDLYLRSPVNGKVLEVPPHMMFGGNIPMQKEGDEWAVAPSSEAYLNVTYNYAPYYYDAFPSEEDNPAKYNTDASRYGLHKNTGGIRAICGLTGAEAVPVLEEMISRIIGKHRHPDGTWETTKRLRSYFVDLRTGTRKEDSFFPFGEIAKLSKRGISWADASKMVKDRYEEHEEEYWVDEGSDGGSYWEATAANALKPLHQLIALSKLRPDGVWSEES